MVSVLGIEGLPARAPAASSLIDEEERQEWDAWYARCFSAVEKKVAFLEQGLEDYATRVKELTNLLEVGPSQST